MLSNSNKQLVCIAAAALSCCTAVEAKTLWSSKPADAGPREGPEYILKSAYPIGNGRLGGESLFRRCSTLRVSFSRVKVFETSPKTDLMLRSYALWGSWISRVDVECRLFVVGWPF